MALGQIARVVYSHRKRDGYGRMLGYMYIDTIFVNAELVRNGLAHVYLFEDNIADEIRTRTLLAAQNEAIENRRGLWSIKVNEESFYLAKRGSLRFHRPNCKIVRDLPPGKYIRFESRLDAFKDGYSPCRNCQP
jgi:hypothetical protein